ncbi:MAG: protease HtpX [Myxococcota bacterium]
MKRILLFVGTNLAVLVLLSIVASLFGVDRFLTANGLNMPALLGFAAVFGFGGAFISLALSKKMALWTTGARVIDQPRNEVEAWLKSTVEQQARQAGIGLPDVAIYDGPEMNAFATGARRNSALVAVSHGLLRGMSKSEVEAVLAHEVSHVANGDMVTMTLLQGVLNTFVIALSRAAGWIAGNALGRSDDRGGGISYLAYMGVSLATQVLLGIGATVIVMAFSRHREFRADAGAAQLVGAPSMIGALQRLQSDHQPSSLPEAVQAFGIRTGGKSMMQWFSSHPPIEARIEALRQAG